MKNNNTLGKPAASPELARFIDELEQSADTELTLSQVRDELQGQQLFMTLDGEIMYRQDRAAFTIELDDLIDCYGADQPAQTVAHQEYSG